jgi:hypothetical protein
MNDASTDGRPPRADRFLAVALGLALAALLWVVLDAVAGAAGPGLRAAAMVHTDTRAAGSRVTFDDASREAAAFLGDRDSVSVVVPWDMTLDELLRLYHLENNASARQSLVDAVGGPLAPGDRVPEGTRIRFALTPSGAVP